MLTEQQIQHFVHLTQSLGQQLGRPGAEDWPDIELTMSQMRTLLFLTEEPRRMSEIAANLGSSLSSATSMVERLEIKGLVERRHNPDDRRVVMCHLTDLGHGDIERFWRLRQSRIRALVHLLTPGEFEHVIDALQIISNALDRARAQRHLKRTACKNSPD